MKFWLIFTKELKSYFKGPIPYVVTSAYSLVSGWIFFNLLVTFIDNTQHLTENGKAQIAFLDTVVLKLFGNLNFLFLFTIPLIAMRVFSEEKKNQTLDLYVLAKVKEESLVFAKYLSSLVVVLFMLTPCLVYIYVLKIAQLKDFNLLYTGGLGLFLSVASYLSMGVFFSALTSNVLVAATLHLVGILFLWLLSWASQISTNYIVSQILKYLSLTNHFENMVRGTFHTQDFIYYFSFIAFFLYLTTKVLKSRKF